MKTNAETKTTIRFGIYMFLTMVLFFFLMKLVGLEKVTELRLFNIVIAAYFSNQLAREKLIDNHKAGYLGLLGSLFAANMIAVVLSCISLLVYTSFIDTHFMSSIGNGFFLGNNLTLPIILGALFMEGTAVAIIVTFSLGQYWKGVKRTTKTIS